MRNLTAVLAVMLLAAGALVAQQREEEKSRYTPIEIISAVPADYPYNSIAEGTVILEVRVDQWGDIEDVGVLRDIKSLTEPAKKAVKKWKFKPASFDGKPVTSTIAVAFNFRTQVVVGY